MTLTELRISHNDLTAAEGQVQQQLEKAGVFFRNLPIVLDLEDDSIDLPAHIEMLRRHDLSPVGVIEPSADQEREARAMGLGRMTRGMRRKDNDESEKPPPQNSADEIAPAAEVAAKPAQAELPMNHVTRMVTTPVRSGQQIYARGGDLIITDSVSAGAEVLADGNIHIYGALRGRALAGAQGDEQARIFCQALGAELVSVAGCYRVSEDLDEKCIGHATQIYLTNGKLIIERLS